MKYKIISFTVALFLFVGVNNTVQGQGVGLSGKRVSVFYNIDYSGSWLPFIIKGRRGFYYNELESEKLSVVKSLFNFRHTIQAEYSLLRNLSVGVMGSYFRDGFGVVEPELFSRNYESFSYGLSLKLFSARNKGAIAPLGFYYGLKLFNTHNKVNFKGNSAKFGDDRIVNESSTDLPGFSFAIGKQGILTKKVLFNLAVEFGFLYRPSGELDKGINLYFSPEYLKSSLSLNHLFRLTFGVGICPF